MVNFALKDFLRERNIELEESFSSVLSKYIERYRSDNRCNVKEVYSLLGVSQQSIYNWRDNSKSTQTRNHSKHDFIKRAGEIFSLSTFEIEDLARKAGLYLCSALPGIENKVPPTLENYKKIRLNFDTEFSSELCSESETILTKRISPENHEPSKIPNTKFAEYFKTLLCTYKGKKIELYESALVSERMFRHIKSGMHLRKESVLALLIAMDMDLTTIEDALKYAGLVLSRSIAQDVVIVWLLKNDMDNKVSSQRVMHINETLYSLGLPLLMTRPKGDSWLV